MSSLYKKPFCYFCHKELTEPENIEIDDNGEIIACCEDCYKIAQLFVEGRKNERKPRPDQPDKVNK